MGVTSPDGFHRVCPYEELRANRGVAALVHGHAVALFRTPGGEVHALANQDPFDRASVLARGFVGTRAGVPVVASAFRGRAFDLRTGWCLDDETVRVAVYQVRVVDGIVEVGPRRAEV